MLSKQQIHDFESFVLSFMAEHQIAGLSVGITSGKELIYYRGFGTRDISTGEPVTMNTMFGMASISKSFTALAIAQLVEAGKLKYEDPVMRYLPDFHIHNTPTEEITIYHLLTHSAGLPPLKALGYAIVGHSKPDPEEANFYQKTLAEMVAINSYQDLINFMRTDHYQRLAAPGVVNSYSNESYALLGAIIEKVSGLSYQTYVKTHIFEPLGMEDSCFDEKTLMSKAERIGLHYKNKDGKLKVSHHWQEAPAYIPAGWVRSNMKDMLEYARMYVNEGKWQGTQLISPSGLAEMVEGRLPWEVERLYGYGFMTQSYQDVTLIEHSGNLKGIATHFGFVPEKQWAAAVFSNTSGTDAPKIWLAAINVLLGLSPDHPRKTLGQAEWSDQELCQCPGDYVSGEGENFTITCHEKSLRAVFGEKEYAIVRTNIPWTGTITMEGRPREVSFFRDPKGLIWALKFHGRVIQRALEIEEV